MDTVLLSQTTSENVHVSGKSRYLRHDVARAIGGYDTSGINAFMQLGMTVRVTQRIK